MLTKRLLCPQSHPVALCEPFYYSPTPAGLCHYYPRSQLREPTEKWGTASGLVPDLTLLVMTGSYIYHTQLDTCAGYPYTYPDSYIRINEYVICINIHIQEDISASCTCTPKLHYCCIKYCRRFINGGTCLLSQHLGGTGR